MPPKEAYVQAGNAANRALQLDPRFADAHLLLSVLAWSYDLDFEVARAESTRAREPDPSIPNSAFRTLASGDIDGALHLYSQKVDRDPLNLDALNAMEYTLFASGRLADAEQVGRRLIELSSNYADAHCFLGEVLLAARRPEEALAVMRDENEEAARLTCQADALWALGRGAEADTLLKEAANKYAGSAAFVWLERAYNNREPEITLLKVDPLLRTLRGDPRFTALLRNMKLPM